MSAPRRSQPSRKRRVGDPAVSAQQVLGAVARWSATWIGWVELDVLLGDVHSLTGKRAHVRPLVADLRRVFGLSASEVDDHDQHRRARIGVSLVAGDGGHIAEVLDSVERFVADRPELERGPRPPVPTRREAVWRPSGWGLSAHRGLASSDG